MSATIYATIYDASDNPIEVAAEYRPATRMQFDAQFGNYLPGDDEALLDVRRVDGEDMSDAMEARATEALWNVVAGYAEGE
jgi:hypothetical protein